MNNFILKMTEQAKGLDLHVLRISFFFGYEYRFKWRCFIELKSCYLSLIAYTKKMLDDSHILNYWITMHFIRLEMYTSNRLCFVRAALQSEVAHTCTLYIMNNWIVCLIIGTFRGRSIF